MAEYLPLAVRPSLVLHAGALLLEPQRELDRLVNEVPNNLASVRNDVDVDRNSDAGSDAGDGMDVDAGGAPAELEDGGATAPAVKGSEVLEKLRTFMTGDFFDGLRERVLQYVSSLHVLQATELPGGNESRPAPVSDDESDDETATNTPRVRLNKEEQRRLHLEQKWSFPDIPGRRVPPKQVDVEFMRTLVHIFMLEVPLRNQVAAVRDRLCQKLHLSAFGTGIDYENPYFPLIIRNMACPWCATANHVDVTSHPARGPGLWVCVACTRLYDKDVMEAKLVELLECQVQAWQSQEVVCNKCRRMRKSRLQTFCECFGRFCVRLERAEFDMVLRVFRTLVAPNNLQWLGETLSMYERLL